MRNSDLDPASYDTDTGEIFERPRVMAPTAKVTTDKAVKLALTKLEAIRTSVDNFEGYSIPVMIHTNRSDMMTT